MPDYLEIPRFLHFVWVGGTIPRVHLDNISKWKAMNRDYQVWLWYDSANFLANTLRKKVSKWKLNAEREGPQFDLAQSTRGAFGTDSGRLAELQQFAQMRDRPDKDGAYYRDRAKDKEEQFYRAAMMKHIVVKDVRAERADFCNMAVYDLELGNIYPNLGAVSDVLRYEILLKYGGIYLDVDIECIRSFPQFLVRADLARFGVFGVHATSAFMGACPGSELVERCRATIRTNYLRLSVDRELQEVYRKDMRRFGVKMTGPTVSNAQLENLRSERERGEGANPIDSDAWLRLECYFPENFVNFFTEAAEVHKWLPPAQD